MRKLDAIGRLCLVVGGLTLGYSGIRHRDTHDKIDAIEQRITEENNLENQTLRGDLYKEERDGYKLLVLGAGLSSLGFAIRYKNK